MVAQAIGTETGVNIGVFFKQVVACTFDLLRVKLDFYDCFGVHLTQSVQKNDSLSYTVNDFARRVRAKERHVITQKSREAVFTDRQARLI